VVLAVVAGVLAGVLVELELLLLLPQPATINAATARPDAIGM
jgi:hypothetical protein